MKFPRSLLAFALFSSPLVAQDLTPPPSAPVAPVPSPDAARNAVLRGIGQVYLEVSLLEGGRAEDADLRGEIRDVIELELRRAGVLIRESAPTEGDSRSPVLRIEVKFDRGAGRFAARLNLIVKDQVVVVRNRESLLAEVWSIERSANASIDTALSREIRSRARDMTAEFVASLRKANGGR